MRTPSLLLAISLATACGDKEGEGDSADAHDHHDHSAHDHDTVTSGFTDGGTWSVTYTVPAGDVPLSEEFDLVFPVAAADDASAMATGASIQVTADMPDHGHGMNQEPVVTAKGDGTFLAEGMLFHMEGGWDIYVTVTEGDVIESAKLSYDCCG